MARTTVNHSNELKIHSVLKMLSPSAFKKRTGDRDEAQAFQGINGSEKGTEERSLNFKSSPLHRYWYWLSMALAILGSSPLQYRQVPGRQRPIVTFKWMSWICFYSLIIQVIRIVLPFWHFYDWRHVLQAEQHKYKNSPMEWIIVILNFTIPLHSFWAIMAIWIKAEKMAELARDCIQFDLMFQNTFDRTTDIYFQNKKWLLSLVVLFVAILLGVTGGVIVDIYFAEQIDDTGRSTIEILIAAIFIGLKVSENWKIRHVFATLLTICVTAMEEIRIQLMLFTASEGFRYIRLGIEDQLKVLDQVPVSVVAKWKTGLFHWRKVVERTGNVLTPFFIPFLINGILFLTALLFLGIQSLMTGQGIWPLLVVTILGTSYMVKIHIKIIMVECIREEEAAITDLLFRCDSDGSDGSGKLEIGKILNALQQNPSKISLNGYVTVDKKLLTKMMGQVVGFLVVLIQFDLGNYVKDKHICICNNETTSHQK